MVCHDPETGVTHDHAQLGLLHKGDKSKVGCLSGELTLYTAIISMFQGA